MSTAVLGSGTFLDLFAPAKGKSEWGMDTLTRRMSGARSLLEAFIASLSQGDFYQGYYLQTWEPDDNPNVATVTLNYKGLLTGGTPEPDIQSEIVPVVGRVSSDFSNAGDPVGVGIIYAQDFIYSFGEEVPGPGSYGTTISYTRPRYTTSAIMEFTYRSAQTTYRYITVGRPVEPRYDDIGFEFTPVVEDGRITLSDGVVYGQDRATAFSLVPIPEDKVVSFTSKNIIGTPWWECMDVVRRELVKDD